jgi:uncharacterized membrane protein
VTVSSRGRADALLGASLLFVAANIAHTVDHFRQGTGRLSTYVIAGGTLISLLGAVVLYLALVRHPLTALVATITGFYAGVAVIAAHLLPHWGVFSDSYPDLGVDAAAWAIVFGEIAAGFVLGIVGLRQLMASRRTVAPN